MHLKYIVLFFCTYLVASHAFPDGGFSANAARKRFRPSPLACNNFPVLGPIPSNYRPLSQFLQQFSRNVSLIAQANDVPSVTVNLVYDQNIIWTQGFGLKNLSNPSAGAPNGDTMYRIGSITKLFTMLLAAIAQDSGYYNLNEEVAKYVPQFCPRNSFPSTKRITFAQLASHMAGLPNMSPCNANAGQCAYTNAQMWNRMNDVQIISPPGTIPSYSNNGFSVLGRATEVIMNSPWSTLVKQKILTPLGMTRSGTSPDSQFLAGSAVGYLYDGTPANRTLDIGWDSPAGAMYSTANDLAKLIALTFRDDAAYKRNTNQILDGQSIREWRQPRYINKDLTGYGYAWEILEAPTLYTKGGSIEGYLSFVATVPQLKFGMTILQSSDSNPTMDEIIDLFINAIPLFTQILSNISPAPYIPAVFRNRLAGTYSYIHNSTVKFSIQQAENYQVMVFEQSIFGFSMLIEYFSDYVYRISTRGAPLDCTNSQAGWEEYIYFTNTRTPTFSLPGLLPGFTGVKLSSDAK